MTELKKAALLSFFIDFLIAKHKIDDTEIIAAADMYRRAKHISKPHIEMLKAKYEVWDNQYLDLLENEDAEHITWFEKSRLVCSLILLAADSPDYREAAYELFVVFEDFAYVEEIMERYKD